MTVAGGTVVSDAEAVAELRAAWAEVSRSYARCWAAMTEVASRTTLEWETAEVAAALTFTTRRADYELCCAQTLIDKLPRVYAALVAGELNHHKARVFISYLDNVTPAQAERISARLVPRAPGWTTGQLAARLLREVQAIDPGYTRRAYEQAVRERGVHGYLDHTGTAVLSGCGLPAEEAAAAAARLESLADALRAAGYPATLHQTRADLFLRLLDGSLDGLSGEQILATMLSLGPLTPADPDPHSEPGPQPHPSTHHHQSPQHPPAEQPTPAEQPAAEQPPSPEQPTPAEQPPSPKQPVAEQPPSPEQPAAEQPVPPEQPAPAEQSPSPEQSQRAPHPAAQDPAGTRTSRSGRCGIEVRVKLSTLLGLDEHPAELPGWGALPAHAARDLVATQHHGEWRVAIVDADGYLLHGDLTRRRPRRPSAREDQRDRGGGIVEIAVPASMLDQLPALATEHPDWARVLAGITGSWKHRDHARAALDAHPHRRFAHAALRRHIHMRDRSCVGVGCRRSAANSELDHTHDHAHGGPTSTTNSGPCCARDHTKKHQGGWTLTQPQPGHFEWISPLGQKYHTRGEPITPDLPEPLPRDPDPYTPGLPMMVEGPILHPPEPPPPAPARPPPTELPDDPPF